MADEQPERIDALVRLGDLWRSKVKQPGPFPEYDRALAAYEDDNPVIIFEHKALYRRSRAPVAWDADYRDVWSPRHLRQGGHATFVTYGEMVHLAEEACAYARAAGPGDGAAGAR